MSFKQCFMKVFTIFSSFEVWYISPLNTWKQQDLDFACFQGGKTSKFKSRKNRLKSTFSHIFFYRTYYFGKRHDMIQCTTFKNHFLKNTCNLRHSTVHCTGPDSRFFTNKSFSAVCWPILMPNTANWGF